MPIIAVILNRQLSSLLMNGSDLETNSFFGERYKIKLWKIINTMELVSYGAVTSQILNLGTGGEGKTMGLVLMAVLIKILK